jgi:large subunit ribosomal protein L30
MRSVKSEDTPMAKKLKITQVRSVIGSQEKKHKRVMTALGFRKNYRTLYKNDSPQIRGMLQKVLHLVEWEEIDEKDIPVLSTPPPGLTVLDTPAGGGGEPDVAGEPGAAGEGEMEPDAAVETGSGGTKEE